MEVCCWSVTGAGMVLSESGMLSLVTVMLGRLQSSSFSNSGVVIRIVGTTNMVSMQQEEFEWELGKIEK